MTTEDPQAPPATHAGPDAATVLASDWPMRPAPAVVGTRTSQYQAIIRRNALDAIHGHGKSITSVEVCGVMVGNVYQDKYGPYLYITGAIRGDRASGRASQVTFTAETWSAIQAVMDREYPEDRIVGWYHTHPAFGVFLSGMDLFIQDHFFNLPWQVAFVYDPIGGDEGMFFWREGKADRQTFLIEDSDTRKHAPTLGEVEAAECLKAPSAASASAVGPTTEESPDTSVENDWKNRQNRKRTHVLPVWLIGVLAFVVSFACTLWAIYSSQSEVIIVPHHTDSPSTVAPLPAQGDK